MEAVGQTVECKIPQKVKSVTVDDNQRTALPPVRDEPVLVSRHLAPVHDHHRSEVVSTPYHSSVCSPSRDTVRNKAAFSSRLWLEDSSYPGIPFQVARFLCESSPDLLKHMEATLHGTEGNPRRASNPVSPLPLTSPLLHMCAVTDALALQESVIGGRSTKPAPPDVVAQVVANVQNQRLQASLLPDQSHSSVAPSLETFRPSENCSSFVAEAAEATPVDTTTAPQPKNSIEAGGSTEPNNFELLRFPKDRITTLVERRFWLSGTAKEEVLSRRDSHDCRDVISSRSSHSSSHSTFDEDDHLALPLEAAKISREHLDTPPTVSEMDSSISERFEIESNFSEHFDLQSNASEVSGLEEEAFRIKKLLLQSSPVLERMKDAKVVDMQLHLDVLREKAAIEGQLEALHLETESLVQERGQLQGQLASARSLTNTQVAVMRTTDREMEALRLRVDELGSVLSKSEDSINILHVTLDAKVEEAIQSREEAKQFESEAQQGRITLQELKVDLESKDGAIRGLKGKVTELHVELQNLLQTKLRAESDLQASVNQVASEQKMKEWYRQQFQNSQAAKSRVQQEVIAFQVSNTSNESMIEKLRFERDQSRQQLAELQERAVREKEGLLRHLESIEADMRERENTFHQLQRDQVGVEESVLSQMKRVEEERARLVQEAFNNGEIKRQLEASKSEVEAKSLVIKKFEKEVTQLIKQLTILQKTMSEKELEIHVLGERNAELESRNKEQQLLFQAKEKQLDTMKQEKVAIEVELKAARRERGDMDVTLVDVRNNVLKLDGRLKQMREELNAKMLSVDKLRQEKLTLEEELKTKDIVIEQKFKKMSVADDEVQKLKEGLHSIRLAKQEVASELSVAYADLESVTGDLNRAVNENASLKERIEVLENFNVSSSTRDDLASKLSKELSDTKRLLMTTESLRSQLRRENQELQKNVAVNEINSALSEERAQSLPFETRDSQQTLSSAKILESNSSQLQKENLTLESELLGQTSCEENAFINATTIPTVEFATQTEFWIEKKADEKMCQNDQLAAEMITQSKTVEILKNEHREQCRRYESNISVLIRKLKASLKINKTLEVEIKTLEEKLTERTNEGPGLNSDSILSPLQMCNGGSNGSKNNDIKIGYYRKKIKSLEMKLADVQKLCEEERRRADHNQELLIELEKQKGKLHAIAEHHSVLKQQTSVLEAALSEKVTAINELDVQAKDVRVRKQRDETLLRDCLKDLQQKFANEQESTRILRKQVFKEKCENNSWKKHAASLKSSLEEVSRMLDTKRSEATGVELEVEKQQQNAYQLRAQVGALEMKLSKSKEEIELLKKEVEQSQAKDPLLADQIKTLGWHLRQKNQEIVALKDQGKQKDEQYFVEVKRIEHSLQSAKRELEAVKSELQANLKEKFDYQSQVTELRSALKLSLERNKAFQTEYTKTFAVEAAAPKSGVNLFDTKLFESPAPYDESLIASLLQKSLALPESRPLSNLQVCLNTLKQEMAILQHQLLNQSNGT